MRTPLNYLMKLKRYEKKTGKNVVKIVYKFLVFCFLILLFLLVWVGCGEPNNNVQLHCIYYVYVTILLLLLLIHVGCGKYFSSIVFGWLNCIKAPTSELSSMFCRFVPISLSLSFSYTKMNRGTKQLNFVESRTWLIKSSTCRQCRQSSFPGRLLPVILLVPFVLCVMCDYALTISVYCMGVCGTVSILQSSNHLTVCSMCVLCRSLQYEHCVTQEFQF